jgi:hypothetical protein
MRIGGAEEPRTLRAATPSKDPRRTPPGIRQCLGLFAFVVGGHGVVGVG